MCSLIENRTPSITVILRFDGSEKLQTIGKIGIMNQENSFEFWKKLHSDVYVDDCFIRRGRIGLIQEGVLTYPVLRLICYPLALVGCVFVGLDF